MINELTADQTEQLAVYRDKWIEIGLSLHTDWDKPAIESAVAAAYAAADLPAPTVEYCGSPMAMIKRRQELLGDESPDALSLAYGSHDAGWLSFYSYARDVLKLECCDPLDGLIRLASLTGWWAPLSEVAVVSPRPATLNRDDNGDLHSEDSPAISWMDGYSLYFWHGVAVPENVIMDPASITLDEVRNEQNAEVRRIKRERYGDSRYLIDIGAKVLDTDTVPTDAVLGEGCITRALMQDDQDDLLWVVSDGSTKRVYTMSVPPGTKTCREAHNALTGLDENQCIGRS